MPSAPSLMTSPVCGLKTVGRMEDALRRRRDVYTKLLMALLQPLDEVYRVRLKRMCAVWTGPFRGDAYAGVTIGCERGECRRVDSVLNSAAVRFRGRSNLRIHARAEMITVGLAA